ncbi:cupin domain-containing protein [Candidatus Sumerlaeota bacterium]|nr:cupin domain-containing protein [Candidatus Sumerlaeales bacterium]NLD61272.1 cupin domain-containing protein [Candidatus Sumerlaeota bacterium]
MTADELIKQFGMAPHPEGGFWVRSSIALPPHPAWSAIYFLLRRDDISRLHVLTADELWLAHGPTPVELIQIFPDGSLKRSFLGLDITKQQVPQITITTGTIFGARVLPLAADATATPAPHDDYALMSCLVIPAFTDECFTLCDREELLQRFPSHAQTIRDFTPNIDTKP